MLLADLHLNKACILAIQGLLVSKKYTDEDFLFTGQRGVLTVPTVNQKVKSWCRIINLKGNYGGHTLRKTFGYQKIYHIAVPYITNWRGSDLIE